MSERFKHSEIIQDDGQTICYGIEDTKTNQIYNLIDVYDVSEKELIKLLNELHEENMMLKGEVAHYKLILMSLEEQAKRLSQIR